jgi:hypothetical protein
VNNTKEYSNVFFGRANPLKNLLVDEALTTKLMAETFGMDEDNIDAVDCIQGLQNMTTNILRYPFWQMLESTAADLFNMGDARLCKNIGLEQANYAILGLYMNTCPTSFKMGFCIPSQCR